MGASEKGIEGKPTPDRVGRSEEHTSELQSLRHLVCRLLLEKKNRIHQVVVIGAFVGTALNRKNLINHAVAAAIGLDAGNSFYVCDRHLAQIAADSPRSHAY